MNKPQPIISPSQEGRLYELGKRKNTKVLFKADGEEVANQYAITEWWMEKDGPGPDPHVHESNDELIYVLEGTISVLLGENWTDLQTGGLVIIPAGTMHTFANNSDQKAGVLNILLGASYEAMMPQIISVFANR